MLLNIPMLIYGYKITECSHTDDVHICETYKGTSKQKKQAIFVVYDMNALNRSCFQEAFLKGLSCRGQLCSLSFLLLYNQISDRKIKDATPIYVRKEPS